MSKTYIAYVNGKMNEVNFPAKEKININNKTISFEVSKNSEYSYLVNIDNKVYDVTVDNTGKDELRFLIDGYYFNAVVRSRLRDKAVEVMKAVQAESSQKMVTSPMPGMVIKINKTVGSEVKTGETLLILEAMKMENEIHSPVDGIVTEVKVKAGTSVEKNTVLLIVE